MNVIKPPRSLVSDNTHKSSIFLAGSIEMGVAEDWQSRVEKFFDQRKVTLYNPRRPEWDSSWEQNYENPQFYQQVNWELNALDKCNSIIMYLVPGTKSPISLLELGLYANSGKISVACPEGFWRRGNVEITCEKYSIPFFDSLEELLINKYMQYGI
jgi:hypothetical protein